MRLALAVDRSGGGGFHGGLLGEQPTKRRASKESPLGDVLEDLNVVFVVLAANRSSSRSFTPRRAGASPTLSTPAHPLVRPGLLTGANMKTVHPLDGLHVGCSCSPPFPVLDETRSRRVGDEPTRKHGAARPTSSPPWWLPPRSRKGARVTGESAPPHHAGDCFSLEPTCWLLWRRRKRETKRILPQVCYSKQTSPSSRCWSRPSRA